MALLDRQLRLLEYLKNKNQWVKSGELAQFLNVTDRTIRSDISVIKNTHGEDIIEVIRLKGYRFNNNLISEDKLVENIGHIVTPIERNIYILKKLITNKKPLNIFEIAEELFVSERSIEGDITTLKKIFSKLGRNDVYIVRDGESIALNGKCNGLLYDVAKYQTPDIQCTDMQKYFQDTHLDFLSSIIIEILNKHNFISRYLSITKFIIEIALIIELNYCDKTEAIYENMAKDVDRFCSIIAEEIKREINEIFDVKLSNKEQDYIKYLLYINRTMDILEVKIKKSDISKDDFYDFCFNEILKLSKERKINYIVNEQLVEDLIIHIKIAMERVKLGIKLDNPLADHIKNKYSYLLDAAIIIGKEISAEYKVEFDFNEISYIAAYLATMLHEAFNEEKSKEKIKILVYVPEGKANLSLIKKQIERILKSKNVVIDGVTEIRISEKIFENNDLIITTSNRLSNDNSNIIMIKENFSVIDKNNIEKYIENIIIEKELYKFMKVCNEYLDHKLFIKNLSVESKEEAINKLCSVLIENNYVNKDYEESVRARENIVSTETDSGIALPHAIRTDAKKNGIAIGILKNPIIWSDRKIKIVVMVAFGTMNLDITNYFIRFFADNVLDSIFIESLRKCTDLQEFQSILTKYFLNWVEINN